MPFVNAPDGVSIHYETEGDGEPLVLMHGGGGDLEGWRLAGYTDVLRDSYRLILIDSRGRGQSGWPPAQEDYELRTRVVDVTTVLDDLKIDRAYFLGYAMGGWIGWGAATYAPQRFLALAIGGFGPQPDPYPGLTVEAAFGDLWRKLADEEQDVMKLLFAETARFGGARQVLKTTLLPLFLYAGDQDDHFSSLLGATQMAQRAEFLALKGKDHRGGYLDDDAVATVTAGVAGFFSAVSAQPRS